MEMQKDEKGVVDYSIVTNLGRPEREKAGYQRPVREERRK